MTSSSHFFSTYVLCPSSFKIEIVDGSLSTFAVKGVYLTKFDFKFSSLCV